MSEECLTIPGLFNRVVSKFPDKLAIQVKEGDICRTLTYKELEEFSLRLSTFLVKRGFKSGDFVGIILENRSEWAVIYFGIMYAGMACIPLDTQSSPQEIKNLVKDSNVKLIFCSYRIFIDKLKNNIENNTIEFVILDLKEPESERILDFSSIEKIAVEHNILPLPEPQDTASLIYTSGTTGNPKGVLLSHRNICSNFLSIERIGICQSSDNFLSILPLHHSYPFMVNLVVPLFSAATVTFLPSGFKPQDLVRTIKEANITILAGVPQLFSLIHDAIFDKIRKIPFLLRPFSLPMIRSKIKGNFGKGLRLLVSGGARLEPKVARDLTMWGFKVIEGYGLTETSPVATFNPPNKVKFGSVGKPIPDVEIKILSPDKTGVGEVLIKGPNVMKGYFKQPQLSASAIREGWFYSGDLGYVDKDGYLFVTGREKEVIVLSSGKTVYPEELEEYYRSSPYIKEICILEKKEKRLGYESCLLYAVVVPDLECFRQKNESNIRGKIRWELENISKSLPSYKHIMGFTVTKQQLPFTALKKIKRYKVKEKYLEKKDFSFDAEETAISEGDLRILSQDISKKVIRYLRNQLKKSVYLDSHLEIDLGVDSLTKVELGLGLEKLFSIKIPDEVIYTVSTVKDIIMKISKLIEDAKHSQAAGISGSPSTWNQILKESPRGNIIKEVRIKTYFLDRLFTRFFKLVFLFIFRIFWFLRIKASGGLISEGPFLICSNHASYLDGFIIFCSLPFKLAINTYFLGYSAIFEHPLVRWAIKLARLIPIDPNTDLIEAMQVVSFVLSNKKTVCIFPEGQRSISEQVGTFKKGVGILIKELDVPVIPVYIKGSHQSWPRPRLLPRFYPVKVIFGKPLYKQDLLKEREDNTLDDYQVIADNLREQTVKLSQKC